MYLGRGALREKTHLPLLASNVHFVRDRGYGSRGAWAHRPVSLGPDRGLFARIALNLVLWSDDKMSKATSAGPILGDTHIRRRLPDEAVRAKRPPR